MKKKYFIIVALILIAQETFSKELRNEIIPHATKEVEYLEKKEVQSGEDEDYENQELLLDEYIQEDGEGIYDFYINGRGVSRTYPVYIQNKEVYLSLYDFIDLLEIKDYKKRNGVLIVKIGIDGTPREIDLNTKIIEKKTKSGKTLSRKNYEDSIIKKNGVIYI